VPKELERKLDSLEARKEKAKMLVERLLKGEQTLDESQKHPTWQELLQADPEQILDLDKIFWWDWWSKDERMPTLTRKIIGVIRRLPPEYQPKPEDTVFAKEYMRASDTRGSGVYFYIGDSARNNGRLCVDYNFRTLGVEVYANENFEVPVWTNNPGMARRGVTPGDL
jgi:hypothetical protein